MKVLLYILLSIIIIIAGIWILNSTGVISLKAWGESLITSLPFLKGYVQTKEAYTQIVDKLEKVNQLKDGLLEENEKLKQELEIARRNIETQTQKTIELERELANLKEETEKEGVRIEKLVKIYGEMEPEKAARIFNSLEDEMVMELLMNLEEEQAANILTELPPEEAARFSEQIGFSF